MSSDNIQAARLKKQAIPFTQIPNEILSRDDISFSLKGLFAYIQSKPEGWQFSAYRIAKETQESETTIKRMLAKLINLGYLIREKHRSGRVTYFIVFDPKCQIATVPNSHGADLAPISNTEDLSNNKSLKKKERNNKSFLSKNVYNLFNSCKDPNHTTKNKYNHFINYLIIHDDHWKENHRPYKSDEIKECENFLSTACEYMGLSEYDMVCHMKAYQKAKTSSDRFCTVFCHWLFSREAQDDYRGFTAEGIKRNISQITGFMRVQLDEEEEG